MCRLVCKTGIPRSVQIKLTTMIKAVIFDFDGVILDTETPDYETWQDEFHRCGVEFNRSMWSEYIGGGPTLFDIPGHLEELVGRPSDPKRLLARRRDYLARIKTQPVLPGITEYLRGASKLDMKIGIASSSSRQWVEGHLTERHLIGYFNSIITRDDVAKVKPDPELYLRCAALLNVKPQSCIVIEDSKNGLAAAKTAGMTCIIVPNPMTADMDLKLADLRLNVLSDMPFETMLSWAETQFNN